MIVIVAGVSGSGKTTVGSMLAGRLGWRFADADAFHPAANIAKMRAGLPLTDADRRPWLRAIGAWMDERTEAGESAVVTCSALKRAYRDALLDGQFAALEPAGPGERAVSIVPADDPAQTVADIIAVFRLGTDGEHEAEA
jgi:gluconokinase